MTEDKIVCPFCGYLHEYENKGTIYCPECRYLISTEEWNILMKKAREASTHPEDNTGINCVTKDAATGNSDSRESSGNDAGTSSGSTPDICPGCGVKLSPGTMRTASSCPFCGHKIADNSKSNGNNHPDFIVRFRKNKNFFISSLKEAVKSSIFVSEEFREAVTSGNNISIKAVYMPFWLFNIRTEGSLKYDQGIVDYIEGLTWDRTNLVARHTIRSKESTGTEVIRNLPQKATSEISDTIAETLEPIPADKYESLNYYDFQSISEQIYRFEDESFSDVITARARNSFEKFLILQNTHDIDYYHVNQTKVKQTPEHIHSALFPLFIAEININGEKCQFAMNGLTGKTSDNIPYSRFKRNICLYTGYVFYVSLYFGGVTWILFNMIPMLPAQLVLITTYLYSGYFFISPFFKLLMNIFTKSYSWCWLTGSFLVIAAELFMNLNIANLTEKFVSFNHAGSYLIAGYLFLVLTALAIPILLKGNQEIAEAVKKSSGNNETMNTVHSSNISTIDKKAGLAKVNAIYVRFTGIRPAVPYAVVINRKFNPDNERNNFWYLIFIFVAHILLGVGIVVLFVILDIFSQ